MDKSELIYDWNTAGRNARPMQKIEFDDETLRDGLQSPSVITPTVKEKIEILHLMDELGLDTADIGLPGAGGIVKEDTLELAMEMSRSKMKMAANCAARTVEQDVAPIIEISQKAGIPIEACLFIGSSPIRQYAEDWPMDKMLGHTRKAVKFAAKNNLPVMYVTEDTTRASPENIRALFIAAIESGASRVCVCDTVGHITPTGVAQVIGFVKKMLADEKLSHIKVDWHGHNDRGLSVWNSIAAIEAGVDRVHGTALGIGERVGNAPLDQILVNLKLLGWIKNDLTKLYDYCSAVSRHTGVAISPGYPVMGKDAFETATGVHASAVIKAFKKNDRWLADRVYSGVPASEFGRKQKISVGPMSGRSNIIWWLEEHKYQAKDEIVTAIFEKAKKSNRLLTDEELDKLVKDITKK